MRILESKTIKTEKTKPDSSKAEEEEKKEEKQALSGTGGVGMFSMTNGEEDFGDQHMASSNPFGMEEEEDIPEVNEDGFEEIKIQDKRPYRESCATENEKMAHNIDTELSQDTEDLEDDWDLIDEVDVEVDKNGFRPPDIMNDPFKSKWRSTVQAYAEKSLHKEKRTYTLKPMIVKANDDCR